MDFLALYPDRRNVLIGTAKAWYKMPLGGTSDQAQKLPQAPTQSLGKLTRIP